MTTKFDTNQHPRYAHNLLNLHIIEGTSYNQAARLAETYGLTVLPQDLIWDKLAILCVRIPSHTDLNGWIKKLESEIAFFRITKVLYRDLLKT